MEEELKPLKEKQKEIDQIASGFSDIQNKYTEGMHDIFYFLQMVHHFTDLKNVSFQQRQVLKYTIDKLRILAIVWVMENCMTKLRRKFKLCKTIWQLKKKNWYKLKKNFQGKAFSARGHLNVQNDTKPEWAWLSWPPVRESRVWIRSPHRNL